MTETTISGGVGAGGAAGQEELPAPPPSPPSPSSPPTPPPEPWALSPPPVASTGPASRLPRGLLVLLGAGMVGLVLMLTGLVIDASIHGGAGSGDHNELSIFTLSNGGHVVLLAGGGLALAAFTAATVRAMSASTRRVLSSRFTATALVTAVAVLAAGTGGALQWAMTAQPPVATGPLAPVSGADAHGIGIVNSHGPAPCRPTAAQKAAAARLVSDTQRATARYKDFAVAQADGYSGPPNPTLTEHYSNGAYALDGKVLQPGQPESLLYTPTSHGMVLVAAMYMMNVPGEFGPEPGGCLTRWHVHTNVCFSTTTFGIVNVLEPGQVCGPGTFRWVPPPVLHVWFLDVPGGRFAAEVDGDYLARAVGP